MQPKKNMSEFYLFVPIVLMSVLLRSMGQVPSLKNLLIGYFAPGFATLLFVGVLARYRQGLYRNSVYKKKDFNSYAFRSDRWSFYIMLVAVGAAAYAILMQPVVQSEPAVAMLAFYSGNIIAWIVFIYLEFKWQPENRLDKPGFKSYHILLLPLLLLIGVLYTVRPYWQTGDVWLDGSLFWLPSWMMASMLLTGDVLPFKGMLVVLQLILVGAFFGGALTQAISASAHFNVMAWQLIAFNVGTYIFMLLQVIYKFKIRPVECDAN